MIERKAIEGLKIGDYWMQALANAICLMSGERERKRKRKTYLLDPLVIEKIGELARQDGRSENQFVERLLFQACKNANLIPATEELLGETRGGSRTQ